MQLRKYYVNKGENWREKNLAGFDQVIEMDKKNYTSRVVWEHGRDLEADSVAPELPDIKPEKSESARAPRKRRKTAASKSTEALSSEKKVSESKSV